MSHLDLPFLENALAPLTLSVFDSIPSTNEYLKKASLSPQLCVAEQQTAGRGRLGKTWFSPPGVNLYLSLLWPMKKTISQLEGLSLAIGLSVIHTLTNLGIKRDIKIKWPNDLYWQEKKLAGILIETNTELAEKNNVVVGLGLNVNMLAQDHAPPSLPWVSLKQILGHTLDRNCLLVSLIKQFIPDLQRFEEQGFSDFLAQWPRWDYLYHKKIKMEIANKSIRGIAQGVNEKGHLIIQTEANTLLTFSSGKVSLLKP
ncbi:MAG: biotin--[acetyl-CoA-carboxylase] ligase [Gammaproteobacteria bacterium]|nr:biotin--[acetyl-CoA-carboxylase] ligase [Gammaproteobacteria bacterium]